MKHRILIGSVVLIIGCGASADPASGDTWKGGATAEELAAASSPDPGPPDPTPVGEVSDEEIINWARMGYTCGNEPSAAVPTPDEIMAKLPPSQRAPRIMEVLMRAPMASTEAAGLVQLIAATNDPRAVSYIVRVFDVSSEIAIRGNRDGLGSGAFVQNESARIRAGAATAAGILLQPEALALLLRAIYDESPTVRQAAVIALAQRPDFDDRALLLTIRDTLHPGMQGAVDAVL